MSLVQNAAAAWLAFVAALVIGEATGTLQAFALAAVVGAGLVLAGFAAASRCRPTPRAANDWTRLTLLSLAVGTALGLGNLAANWAIARADPSLRMLLVERLRNIDPVNAVIVSPILEEIAVRLFLMSVVVWLAFRITKRRAAALGVGLAGSALVFALLHLWRPVPADPALANWYRFALVTKYTLAALPLGWVFWRWGLPYAILCHAAANAAHLVVQDRVI